MRRLAIVAVVAAAAAAACRPVEPPLHNVSRVVVRPGEVSLASLADFDIGMRMTGRDCSLPVALRGFGDVAVHDCGRFNLDGVLNEPPSALVPAALVAARTCATRALAAREPFVLVWHDSGGDPICDDMALSRGIRSECGFQIETATHALLALRGDRGYETYWIESHRGWSKDSTRPGEVAEIETHAQADVQHCAQVTPVTDESCDGVRLQDCFLCEDGEQTTDCASEE